jgi:hypothetical protein
MTTDTLSGYSTIFYRSKDLFSNAAFLFLYLKKFESVWERSGYFRRKLKVSVLKIARRLLYRYFVLKM